MKYLKTFENNNIDPELLCIKNTLTNNITTTPFKVGNIYKTFRKFGVKNRMIIDRDNNEWFINNTDEYTFIIPQLLGTLFTTDKSMEDYKKRLTQNKFDL